MNPYRRTVADTMGLAIEVIRPDTREHETFSCVSSPVRIGRSPLNNVVLAAPWVSLHHGLIHFDEQRASYSDLGSTNGTTVVAEQEMKLHPMVPVQILGPGQDVAELRIGAIALRVRRDHTASQPASGKRGYDTRLNLGEGRKRPEGPPSAAGHPSARPDVYEAPRPGDGVRTPPESGWPPAPGGRAPLYHAGMTRMVMPGEQDRMREAPASVPGAIPVGAVSTPAPSQSSGPVHETLARLGQAWSGAGGLQIRGQEKVFAETLAAVADAFARGLVELKKGLKEFGEGIGVRAVGGHSPLHRSQTASELLSYLLDPQGDTHERLEQLVDLFADLMIHEVALLSGVKAGVRQLLTELDPEGGYARSDEGRGGPGLFDRSLRRYREYFKSATEDDGQAIVFGAEFARAYANALGGGGPPGTPRRRS
jgi:predicted component of type VI protein secretion system